MYSTGNSVMTQRGGLGEGGRETKRQGMYVCMCVYLCIYIHAHTHRADSLLEKAMVPHSSTLAWKIPWMEEPGRLKCMGSLRVGHD